MSTPQEKKDALVQVIVTSAMWGWDMHRRGATQEQTERLASDVSFNLIVSLPNRLPAEEPQR